ncbi:hypothetical protein [Candidatus Accumulibacter aalborgensis]|uniref:hypothetical protein n=1 Tax=Candidatus Accumulibacter aalborgensis TaxID=1860102 RepID=UPI00164466E9|nr:hypothetical protein [Candidatus Accumulibacter aalborgensis]
MNPLRQVYEDAPAFIPIPEVFQHRRIEVVLSPLENTEPKSQLGKRRTAPPRLAGKARDVGDVMSSIAATDWGMRPLPPMWNCMAA